MQDQEPADGQWLCKPCHTLFSSREALNEHKASARAKSRGRDHIHCKFCGMDFTSATDEVLHIQKHHPAPQSLECPGCGQGPFTRAAGLIQHIEGGECARIDSAMVDEMRDRKLEFPKRLEEATKQPIKNNFAKYMPFYKPVCEPLWDHLLEDESLAQLSIVDEEASQPTKGANGANGTTNALHHDASTGVKAAEEAGDPHDPDSPSFNAARYRCAYSGSFICPKPYCIKAAKTARDLVKHLRSPAHAKKLFTCPYCWRKYSSLTAITQHAESNSSRCQLRNSNSFQAYMDQLTAGLIDVDSGRFEDGAVVYKTSKGASELYGGKKKLADAEVGRYEVKKEKPVFW